jgi:hypothetical protein
VAGIDARQTVGVTIIASMKSTNSTVAMHKAEQRVCSAVEKVKAAENKARAAKEKAWRTKLLFKLARRASKKAKKAAKRARAKAVQAQIALRELTEQISPAARLPHGTRHGDGKPERKPRNQPSTAAQRKRTIGASKARAKPSSAPAFLRPDQKLESAESEVVEPVSMPPGALAESEVNFGELGNLSSP